MVEGVYVAFLVIFGGFWRVRRLLGYDWLLKDLLGVMPIRKSFIVLVV